MHAMHAGCSASPTADDNLFVWTATVFGPDGELFLRFQANSSSTLDNLPWHPAPLHGDKMGMWLATVREFELLVTSASSAAADSPWEGGIFCLRYRTPLVQAQSLHLL